MIGDRESDDVKTVINQCSKTSNEGENGQGKLKKKKHAWWGIIFLLTKIMNTAMC